MMDMQKVLSNSESKTYSRPLQKGRYIFPYTVGPWHGGALHRRAQREYFHLMVGPTIPFITYSKDLVGDIRSLRVQVPNNHILTQNLYHNSYYPKPKYLIIGHMDPLGQGPCRRHTVVVKSSGWI